LYEALNKGIKQATGDIIGFIHSDDFYTSNIIIEKYASEFLKSKSDAVYSDLYYVNALNTDDVIRKWKSGEYKPKSFYFGWMPPHPTFFVKKNIYKAHGDFNLNLKSAADYELMLRFILKNKIIITYLPEFTIKMRIGGKSNASLSNRFKANKEDRQAWDINGLKPKFYTLYFKPLRKLIQFF
jgi:glycosyltransferase involved in cell wall biosynthesis